MPDVSVVTPTIPGRELLLEDARLSVEEQDLAGTLEHRVMCDILGVGPARVRNALLEEVDAPLVAFLDDDDLLDPDHLSSLLALLAETDASVAYSWCRTVGPARVRVPRPLFPRETWRTMKAGRNVIPVTVVAKTSAIRAGGCFRESDRYEDYALWMRLHALKHPFALLPRETWTYRMLGENRTHT